MPKKRKGPPSKFDELDLEAVRKLAEYGHTDDFMSDFFSVPAVTWHKWKKQHPEFFKSLKGWKKVADDRVERAMYESALGYEYEEDAVVWDRWLKERVKVTLEKRCPPNFNAARFWLLNRRPEEWRPEKLEVSSKHSGSVAVNGEVKIRVDDMELEERIRMLAEGAAEERIEQITFGRELENALQ